MKITNLTLDESRVRNGVWWSYATRQPCRGNTPTAGVFCVLVRPRGAEFFAAYRDALAPYEMAEREGKLPSEAEERVARVWAEHVFLGWSCLEDEQGQPLPYSVDQAARMMRAEEFRLVRAFVVMCEASESGYLRRAEDQAKGN